MTTQAPEGIFEQYGPFGWEVAGRRINFPVVRVSETYGNRLPAHKRLHRDGARHDSTGGDARVWKVVVDAQNDIGEPGIEAVFYPDVVNELCDSFSVHEVGTLYTSTRGPRRCKAQGYERVEDMGERDTAALVFTWVEDNEDDQTASSFQAPSARSVAGQEAEAVADAIETEGWGGGNLLSSIKEFGAGLEAFAQAPGDLAADLEAQANAVVSTIDQVETAFADALYPSPNPDVFDPGGPEQHAPLAKAAKLKDTAQRARADALSSMPQTTVISYRVDVSLFVVAGDTGNSFEALLKANAGLNPLSIPAGTPIRVFAAS